MPSIAGGAPVLQFPCNAGKVTQKEIIEARYLTTLIKKKRMELAEIIERRNALQDSISERLLIGCPVEDGPHTASATRVVRLDLS